MNFYYFKIKDREAVSSMSTRQLKATQEMISHHYSFSCHGKQYHVKNYVHIHKIYCLQKNICNHRFLFAYSLNCRCFNTLLHNLFSLSHLFISILMILHVYYGQCCPSSFFKNYGRRLAKSTIVFHYFQELLCTSPGGQRDCMGITCGSWRRFKIGNI